MNNIFGLFAAFAFVLVLILIAICILIIVTNWKIFVKAGKPGWAALIPFYREYIYSDISFGNSNFFIGYMIITVCAYIAKIFSIVVLTNLAGLAYLGLYIAFCIKIANAFRKSAGFTVGLVLLPVIFFPILGFGSDEYIGPQ